MSERLLQENKSNCQVYDTIFCGSKKSSLSFTSITTDVDGCLVSIKYFIFHWQRAISLSYQITIPTCVIFWLISLYCGPFTTFGFQGPMLLKSMLSCCCKPCSFFNRLACFTGVLTRIEIICQLVHLADLKTISTFLFRSKAIVSQYSKPTQLSLLKANLTWFSLLLPTNQPTSQRSNKRQHPIPWWKAIIHRRYHCLSFIERFDLSNCIPSVAVH